MGVFDKIASFFYKKKKQELNLTTVFKTREVMIRILNQQRKDLTKTKGKITKMIFLMEWESYVKTGKPLLGYAWRIKYEQLEADGLFDVLEKCPYITQNANSIDLAIHPDSKMPLCRGYKYIYLRESDMNIIDNVTYKTDGLSYKKFIDLVNASFPLQKKKKNLEIDLSKAYKEYKRQMSK